MKPEEIKTVVFTVLNPRGVSMRKNGSSYTDGGNHNGYVAIPKKYESLLDYDDDYNEYNLPSVHGGCTFTRRDFDLTAFNKWNDAEIVNGQFEEGEKYFVVGFDTLHYNDTEEIWPKEAVAQEAMEWDSNIRQQIAELVEQKNESDKVEAGERLHEINLGAFFSNLPKWPIEEMTGYKPCTTFWQDFSIADVFVLNGQEPNAVLDTHQRSWSHVKEKSLGIEGLTEYIMVLNWKIHQHHPNNMTLANIYNELWREADAWAMENLTGNDLDYYLETTD